MRARCRLSSCSWRPVLELLLDSANGALQPGVQSCRLHTGILSGAQQPVELVGGQHGLLPGHGGGHAHPLVCQCTGPLRLPQPRGCRQGVNLFSSCNRFGWLGLQVVQQWPFGQPQGERRALAQCALNLGIALMQGDDFSHKAQPQSGSGLLA